MGDPKRRDVQKVLEDVLEGKVSPGAAASEYGVALKRDKMLWTVDEEQTDVLRIPPEDMGRKTVTDTTERRLLRPTRNAR